MKPVITILAIIVFAGAAANRISGHATDKKTDHQVERKIPVDPNVTVTLCVMAGQITVRSWNKNEIRARSVDVEQIELKRVDRPGEAAGAPKKIDVFIDDKADEQRARGDCQASADVELDVPSGATVQIQTRDGDIRISGVAAAYAGSQNGDITIEHVAQKIEAGSIGGSISVRDSNGRVTLTTAGGGIEATNLNPVEAEDSFEVTSVSGDIQLEKVTHAKVSARSVTGNINLLGSLAHSGSYGFNTMSGDVTLALPADASFRLVARLAQDGEITTDFPLTLTTESVAVPRAAKPQGTPPSTPAPTAGPPSPPGTTPSSKSAKPDKNPAPDNVTIVKVAPVIKVTPISVPYALRRVNAVHGSGDAAITVASFSGSLHLQKN